MGSVRLERHYMWRIRQIERKLDEFPRCSVSNNSELNFERFAEIRRRVELSGGRMDSMFVFLMNAREGFVLKLARLGTN
jgi:hypothetical protein